MAIHNWVCFHCQRSVRRSPHEPGRVACPTCQRDCENIGYKLRLPRRRNKSGWRKLEQVVSEGRGAYARQLELRLARLRELSEPNQARQDEMDHLERLRRGQLAQPRALDE